MIQTRENDCAGIDGHEDVSVRFAFQKVFCVLAAAASLGMADAEAETIHVFLIGGQSNADGRASSRGLPRSLQIQNDVAYFYAIDHAVTHVATTRGSLTTLRKDTSRTGEFGPEITFGRSMADYYAAVAEPVALVKFAAGGTNLAVHWAADGTGSSTADGAVYQSFQFIVAQGLAALHATHRKATLRIEGMIWMHGEKDAAQGHGASYQGSLARFVSDIRLTYGSDLPFVVGQLSSGQTGTGAAPEREMVRAAQATVAGTELQAALVNTDALTLSDSLHFDFAGQLSLGREFAAAMKSLLPPLNPSVWASRFIQPSREKSSTRKTTFSFRGVAAPGAVRSIHLVNARLGTGKYFKARGVRNWSLKIALERGRNVIDLYAQGVDGVRWKIERRIVVRR